MKSMVEKLNADIVISIVAYFESWLKHAKLLANQFALRENVFMERATGDQNERGLEKPALEASV
jgi:hypothetical protein